MDPEQDVPSQSLEQIIRRRALWILLCIVVVGAGAYVYAKHKTKEYTATSILSFSNNSLSQEIAGLSSTGGSGDLIIQQNTNRELVRSGDVAVRTAKVLGLTPEKVASGISVGGPDESSSVDVSAKSTSPVLAAAMANTYSKQFVIEQNRTNNKFFRSALAAVDRQLAKLSGPQRFGSVGVDLQERAHTLSLLTELGYNNAEVIQEALTPSSPSSPKVHKDALLGAGVGLLIGLALAFLLERFDRRIREPEELEAIYGLPLLGAVQKSAALKTRGSVLPASDAESFSLIRAHLRFFNIGRDMRALVVASAAPGDGKTTIAVHLAEAAARSGAKALLLEADLRKPTVARQLGIQAPSGLAEVLIGAVSLDEATVRVSLDAARGGGSTPHALHVLTAGPVPPPNPGELLESNAMEAVIERARVAYDLVVIDTPPLTAVSDGFPLLPKADGVVIVGWVGKSRRDVAGQLRQVLADRSAPLLGVIANGSKSGGPGKYPSPAGEGPVVTVADADSKDVMTGVHS